MGKIDPGKYGGLGGYSPEPFQEREPGIFIPCSISVEPRKGIDVGTIQGVYEYDKNESGENNKYLFKNQKEINFVIMFIKRYWQKIEKINGKDVTTAFGWDTPKPENEPLAKYTYNIAGMYLNEKKEKVPHPIPLFEGKFALIYFKCSGVKFDGAMKLVSSFKEKSKSLSPLTNDPEFEANVVTPRRFITKAIVGLNDTKYGKRYVFSFEPSIKLGDDSVEKFMDMSLELSELYKKQFDKTGRLNDGQKKQVDGNKTLNENPTFSDNKEPPATATSTPEKKDSDFELGI